MHPTFENTAWYQLQEGYLWKYLHNQDVGMDDTAKRGG